MSEQFQVGDLVYKVTAHGISRARIARMTQTQVVITQRNVSGLDVESRFRRADGSEVSSRTWDRAFIALPTPELDARWAVRLRAKLFDDIARAASMQDEALVRDLVGRL